MAVKIMEPTEKRVYYVVHPLDDVPEVKQDTESLGPMAMSPSVRFALFALRGYLVVMALLVAYRAFAMAAH
ncbi:MAG TPA: hypothetical protein VGM37_15545 [Armatimonadota bacterium]|jgi:hypothetical protein